MSEPQPTTSDASDDLQRIFDVFEDAWYEEPPRYLSADDLCALLPDLPERHAQIKATYGDKRRSLRRSDIKLQLENAVRDKRPVDWDEIIGPDNDLRPWAHDAYERLKEKHFVEHSCWTPEELIAQARLALNLDGYEGVPVDGPEDGPTPSREAPRLDFKYLGEGGFGVVFEARDKVLDRRVAIKKVLPKHLLSPAALGRLVREAHIVAKLDHPNILPVYGLLRPRDPQDPLGEPAFVMRLLPRTPVDQRREVQPDPMAYQSAGAAADVIKPNRVGAHAKAVEEVRRLKDDIEAFHRSSASWDASEERRLAFRRLLERFVDVCQAIAYAHFRGVVHRDIKPSNVVIGPHGETLVIDWGIADRLADSGSPNHDHSEILPFVDHGGGDFTISGAGTRTYASPEQMGQHNALLPVRDPADGKLRPAGVREPTDVYSLGATLFSMFTGRDPAQEVAYAIRHQNLPAWLPEDLRDAVHKATAFNPWDRYIGPHELHWYRDRGLAAGAAAANQPATGSPTTAAASAGQDPRGGVEQLRDVVQSWLDAEAHQRIAKPLEDQIAQQAQSLAHRQAEVAQTQQLLELRQDELSQTTSTLATKQEEVSQLRTAEARLKKTKSSLFAITVSLALLAAALGLGGSWYLSHLAEQVGLAEGLRIKSETDAANIKRVADDMERLAEKRRREADRAQFERDTNLLRTSLDLIRDRHFPDARHALLQAKDPPDQFAWNYARFAAGAEPLKSLTVAPDGVSAHAGAVLAVAATTDGNHYLTFGADGRLLTWDATEGIPVREAFVGPRVGRAGLLIQLADEQVVVNGLVDGLPAAQSGGFEVGDRILAVGPASEELRQVDGLSLNEMNALINGEPDTEVFVQIQRDQADPAVVRIAREGFTAVSQWQQLQRFSPDGRWLAASGTLDQKTVSVWLIDTATGDLKKEWTLAATGANGGSNLASPSDLMSLSFSQDGSRLLIAGGFPQPGLFALLGPVQKAVVVDLTTSNFPQIDQQASAGFPPLGWVLAADGSSVTGIGLSTESNPFGRWQVGDKSATRLVGLGSMGDLTSATAFMSCVSPDGRFLAMAGVDQPVQLFDGNGSKWLVSLDGKASRRAAAFSQDSSLFAIANGRTLDVYGTGGWLLKTMIHFDMTYQSTTVQPALAFSADNQTLLVGSEHGLQSTSLAAAMSNPAVMGFGQTSLSAARWTSRETAWVAQHGGPGRGGIAVREVQPDGTVVSTLVNGLGGQHELAVMSQDGNQVLVPRMNAPWSPEGRLESWALEPELHRRWTYSSTGNSVRPISMLADGSVLAEFSAAHFGVAQESLKVGETHSLDSQGRWRRRLPTVRGALTRVSTGDEGITLFPRTDESFRQGSVSPARISIGPPGDEPQVSLPVQATNAVISDDGKFLAAVVISPGQNDGTQGKLTVYGLPDGNVIAEYKERPIGAPFNFALNFSPDGHRIAAGTVHGDLIVWDHIEDKKLCEAKWKSDGWVMPWLTGATFTPDGEHVVVSAWDYLDFVNVERIGRDITKQHGALGVVDLTDEEPAIRHLDGNLGLVALGESSIDRRRVASTNVVTGEVRVWDIAGGEPRELAKIPDQGAGEFHPQWADIAIVRAIAPTADGAQVAVVGPVRRLNAKTSRIVIFETATGRIAHGVDVNAGIADDLVWHQGDLCLLTHDPLVEGQDFTVRLLRWSPGTAEAAEVASYHEIGKQLYLETSGALVGPRFSDDGLMFAIPIRGGARGSQTVGVHRTEDGGEVARPAQVASGEVLHAFNWTSDGRILLSSLLTGERQRRLAVWNPVGDDFTQFTIEEVPVTGTPMYNTGIFHLAMTPDGSSIAAQWYNQSVLDIWSVKERELDCRIQLDEPAVLRRLEFSPAGDALLMFGNVQGGQILRAPRPEHPPADR